MAEELEANPAEGVTPVVEAPQQEAEDGVEEFDELDKLAGLAPEEGEPEEAEVEYEGKTYKLPPELRDAFLRQQDYTKKTMSVAEERKALEEAKARIEEISGFSEESRTAMVQAAALRMQLQELENTPLDGMSQEQQNSLILRHQMIERNISQLEAKGKEAADKERGIRSQQFAKARENVVSETAKHIPNFTDQRRTELEAFATTLGASPEFVQQITDPLVYKTLHLADIGQKFIDRQKKARQVTDAQQATPAEQVGGKARSGKSLSNMSPEEYHKARMKQRGPI